MFRVFNMGVGMIAAVRPSAADELLQSLTAVGERAWVCGEVIDGEGVHLVGLPGS